MTITLTVFIIVCSLFALRGAILGFTAWLTRILGLISGYLLSFIYREDVASIVSIYAREWPPILLQVFCGIALFFAGTILVNMFISSLVDFLRKTNPSFNKNFQYKSSQGRILGAMANSALGAFVVFLGIWGYGVGQSFQLVPALPANNQGMQKIANTVGQASFGFLLEQLSSTKTQAPTESISEVDISSDMAEQFSTSQALPKALSLEELRQQVHSQQTKNNIETATVQESSAEITLMIEDVQGHDLSAMAPAQRKNTLTSDNSSLQELLGDNNSKKNINNEIQKVLQNKALLTATLSQYMSADEAKAAGTQLQTMMKDPAMQKMMQDNIQKMMDNPAAIQEMLQKRNQNTQ